MTLDRIKKLFAISMILFFVSCSKEEEPVQPTEGAMIDPNAPASPSEQPAAAPADDTTKIANEGANTPLPPTEPATTAPDTSAAGDVPGALTDEPVGAPAVPPASDYTTSFDDGNKEGKKASKKLKSAKSKKTKAPAVEAAPAAVATAGTSSAVQGEGKSRRYVKSLQLNVRSAPNNKSKIVRRINRGDVVKVTLMGKWAKLGEGEFIRTKHLSKTKTKAASQNEIDRAWKK